ncbi:hypothetical protein MX551_004724 [Salmonella enterica]|nr:hypothetical protein [Salmonella enterica]EJC1135984.1 hypothetical protein [Salmonella enterica]EJC1459599.1 hypothetical protein [Salmonella enterica]
MAKITIDDKYFLSIYVEEGDDKVNYEHIVYQEKDKKTGDPLVNEDGTPKMREADIYSQIVLLARGRERVELKLSFKEGQAAYPVGRYVIPTSFFKVNERGNLNTGSSYELILIPFEVATGKQ